MTVKGIDVSKWQGKIDWKKVKAKGIKFAILRASCSRHEDSRLKENVQGCIENGIDFGFYHALYATTMDRAIYEASVFLEAIAPYKPTYPVYVDCEYWEENGVIVNDISGKLFTDFALKFADIVESQGYYTGIYASKDFLENTLEFDRLKHFDVWLAQWGSKPTWSGNFGLWQNKVLRGNVSAYGMPQSDGLDMNIAYRDYPAIIKSHGLNKTSEPVKLYEISAVKAGLTKPQANKLAENLSKMGMEVEVK